MMPGESSDERPIPFDPKPLTVALEAQIDSLRDEVVDLVALRARLEARMKARLEGEDWAGLEEALKEFSQADPSRRIRPAAHQAQGRRRPRAGGAQDRRLDQDGPGSDQRPAVHDRPLPRRRDVQGLCRGARRGQDRGRHQGESQTPRKPALAAKVGRGRRARTKNARRRPTPAQSQPARPAPSQPRPNVSPRARRSRRSPF